MDAGERFFRPGAGTRNVDDLLARIGALRPRGMIELPEECAAEWAPDTQWPAHVTSPSIAGRRSPNSAAGTVVWRPPER